MIRGDVLSITTGMSKSPERSISLTRALPILIVKAYLSLPLHPQNIDTKYWDVLLLHVSFGEMCVFDCTKRTTVHKNINNWSLLFQTLFYVLGTIVAIAFV